MTSSVRIVRAVPAGTVTRPKAGVPVIATIHWSTGGTTEVAALATAWTADAVEIAWASPIGLRQDWVPAAHIRRPGQPPRPETTPPRSSGRRGRWGSG
jgi:hypothetical protein